MNEELKAYRSWDNLTDVQCVIRAATAGKARYRVLLSARDAGYKMEFLDIYVVRAPKFDGLLGIPTKHPVALSHVENHPESYREK